MSRKTSMAQLPGPSREVKMFSTGCVKPLRSAPARLMLAMGVVAFPSLSYKQTLLPLSEKLRSKCRGTRWCIFFVSPSRHGRRMSCPSPTATTPTTPAAHSPGERRPIEGMSSQMLSTRGCGPDARQSRRRPVACGDLRGVAVRTCSGVYAKEYHGMAVGEAPARQSGFASAGRSARCCRRVPRAGRRVRSPLEGAPRHFSACSRCNAVAPRTRLGGNHH